MGGRIQLEVKGQRAIIIIIKPRQDGASAHCAGECYTQKPDTEKMKKERKFVYRRQRYVRWYYNYSVTKTHGAAHFTWRQFQFIGMPAVLGSASPGFHANGSSAVYRCTVSFQSVVGAAVHNCRRSSGRPCAAFNAKLKTWRAQHFRGRPPAFYEIAPSLVECHRC